MQKTITPGEMQDLEKRWMNENGVPGILLMEYAARGVADAIAERLSPPACVLFVCGPGNNGGDGYAAARLWVQRGGKAVILTCGGEPAGDAAVNRRLALNLGIPVLKAENTEKLPDADLICDAIFGTGLNRAPDGICAETIRKINEAHKPVLSVDIPSGLSGLTGCIPGEAVHASETVTFHRIKQGLLLRQGPACTGRLRVCPILIPSDWGGTDGYDCMEPRDLDRLIPARPVDAHKGTLGRVVIFAGSPGMCGAAAFCGNAAVRAGAGLTYLLCRSSLLPVLQVLAPACVAVPLPEKGGALLPEAADIAAAHLSAADAAAVGCGLGRQEDLLPLLEAFAGTGCPVVWDADALNLLAKHAGRLRPGDSACLTPHPGEAARLLGESPEQVVTDPESALKKLRETYHCGVLLKVARTLMTDGRSCAINRWGTPAMAKGGSGDVLTGILAALLARRRLLPDLTVLQCMQLAAMVHGLAGIRAAGADGLDGLTPESLIRGIRLDRTKLPLL